MQDELKDKKVTSPVSNEIKRKRRLSSLDTFSNKLTHSKKESDTSTETLVNMDEMLLGKFSEMLDSKLAAVTKEKKAGIKTIDVKLGKIIEQNNRKK